MKAAISTFVIVCAVLVYGGFDLGGAAFRAIIPAVAAGILSRFWPR